VPPSWPRARVADTEESGPFLPPTFLILASVGSPSTPFGGRALRALDRDPAGRDGAAMSAGEGCVWVSRVRRSVMSCSWAGGPCGSCVIQGARGSRRDTSRSPHPVRGLASENQASAGRREAREGSALRCMTRPSDPRTPRGTAFAAARAQTAKGARAIVVSCGAISDSSARRPWAISCWSTAQVPVAIASITTSDTGPPIPEGAIPGRR
jgi:hypothetical protein